jgi:thiol-disulfide isomerase/thioredoxin
VEGYSGNEVNVIMFHVDWCPYCKSALPVWRKLTENYNGVTMNRKKVNIISLDATDENSTSEDFGGNSIEEIMSSFKIDGTPYTIEGYPTIVIADKDNNVLAEFEKTSTYENLENFINDNMRI